jgi:hypothetical protein
MILVSWVISLGWFAYGLALQAITGLDYLALSLVVFVLAMSISLTKSGALAKWVEGRKEAMSGETG